MDYSFFQQYWWFLVSLLGALLVFLMFVQGGNTLIYTLGKDESEQRMLINSTGRKWELTFTTLVTFGGAFFASFPLFYSTSFGGAYWLWMLILLTFVVQAVSYEFQHKKGNLLGAKPFQICLIINGIAGPLLIGGAVATFFEGSNFVVSKGNLTESLQPVISSWANGSHGLDALLNPWVWVLGLAVVFLARILGILYFVNNVDDAKIRRRSKNPLIYNTVAFLAFFLTYFIHLLIKEGYAVNPATGIIMEEPFKYLNNLVDMWWIALLLVVGVGLVLYGIMQTVKNVDNETKPYIRGIWLVGPGVVLVVLSLLLCAGYNNTAYYPSTANLQCSLTLSNSCSSEFTLKTMSIVSLLIPFVLAYIVYAWHSMDKKKIDRAEVEGEEHLY